MSMSPGPYGPVSAKGNTGTITFDGRAVTIARTGLMARSLVGSGSTTVPIESVMGVDFKPTGARKGHITILVAGTIAQRRDRLTRVSDDPMTVEFTFHTADFRRVKDAIEAAIRYRGAQPPPAPQPPPVPALNEQLANLARLRDQGVLTDEEFTAAKARLLGL